MDIEATGEVSRTQGVDFYFNGCGYPTNVNFVVEAQGITQIVDFNIMYATMQNFIKLG